MASDGDRPRPPGRPLRVAAARTRLIDTEEARRLAGRIEAGKPVRLRFDRHQNSDCSARVVFPDLRKSATLAAFGTTTLDPDIPEPRE